MSETYEQAPDIDYVRSHYPYSPREFDRALAAHDAEIQRAEPTDAQVEAAVRAFNDHGGIRRSIEEAMRAAVRAAKEIS